MSADIVGFEHGIITLKVSGRLVYAELVAFQKAAAELMRDQSKVSFLILVQEFLGWEQAGEWNDLTFMYTHDPKMKKMAIVVDPHWKDLATLFVGKGLRQCRVECFPPGAASRAQAWLLEEA